MLRRRGRFALKRVGIGIAVALAGLVFAVFVAFLFLREVYITPAQMERTLAALSGRGVEIRGSTALSFWGEPRLTLSQLRIRNPPDSSFKHLAILDSISVSLRWWDLPAALVHSHPHFLDIRATGGKLHLDARTDVVGADGVWPSADDPFTGLLGWINTFQGKDLSLEFQVDEHRIEKILAQQLDVSFGTGTDGAVLIDADAIDLTVTDIPVKGALALDAPIVQPGSAPPASLVGHLAIDTLDLGALAGQPGPTGSNTPTDETLPVQTCLAWDTDLAVSIGALQLKHATLSGARFHVGSSGGNWKVQLTDTKFPAGEGQGELSLRCEKLPGALDIHFDMRSKGETRFNQSGAEVQVLGRMEAMFSASGEGNTWKEIANDLDGRVASFLGPVETGSLEDDLYARNLFHALTVSWGQSKKAVVDCAVFDMKIEAGVGKSRRIMASTPTLVIDGHGRVEFGENRIEIVLIPRAKHLTPKSIHVPVLISGQLQHPKIGLDWKDALPRLGVEAAAALVDPVLGALPFPGLRQDERAACRRALEPLSRK